ncbi:MAG: hypothetical protein IIA67_09370, partial [Planctomycetes bacterium]|nr:hypothetical protein [Planctomycetota bacterium]
MQFAQPSLVGLVNQHRPPGPPISQLQFAEEQINSRPEKRKIKIVLSQVSDTPTGRRRMITRTDSPTRSIKSKTNSATVTHILPVAVDVCTANFPELPITRNPSLHRTNRWSVIGSIVQCQMTFFRPIRVFSETNGLKLESHSTNTPSRAYQNDWPSELIIVTK